MYDFGKLKVELRFKLLLIVMSYYQIFESFKKKYKEIKKKDFFTPLSREFVYDCIKNNVYNTELVCTLKWVKNVSRFIADKKEHLIFLERWCKKNNLEIYYRLLTSEEKKNNMNNKINYIVYICKDLKWKNIIIEYEQGKRDYTMWEILWYPKCCSDFWQDNNLQYKITFDFVFNKYLDWWKLLNNPFFNFTAYSFTFFFPCKLSCTNALKKYTMYASVIEKDNKDFYNYVTYLFWLPIFIYVPNTNVLTTNLHFDEIFRVHFVWKLFKNKLLVYKDFFIVSYSFLDQKRDERYTLECLDILDKLLYGDNIIKKDNLFIIRKWTKVIKKIDWHNKKFIQFK